MASKDLYAVLGLARGATEDAIRSAYRKLARELHPDMKPGDKQAEARFKEVSAAYSVLSDAKKRALYDEFGEVALQAGFDEARARALRGMGGGRTPFDFGSWTSDAFSSFSGGGGLEELLQSVMGGRRRRHGPRRGADLQATLTIELALALRGGPAEVRLAQPGRERVEVRVPAGIKDGQTLRLSGLGGAGADGGPAGDLLVEVRVAPHPIYRREGDDLHVEVPVTIPEAVAGGKVSFMAPSGELSLTLPPGTQSGRTLRLKGQGVGGKGDLYARIQVVLPEGGDPRLAELAAALAPLYSGDVRERVRL